MAKERIHEKIQLEKRKVVEKRAETSSGNLEQKQSVSGNLSDAQMQSFIFMLPQLFDDGIIPIMNDPLPLTLNK